MITKTLVHLINRDSTDPPEDGAPALCGALFAREVTGWRHVCWDPIRSYVVEGYRAAPETFQYCEGCSNVAEGQEHLLLLDCTEL